MSDKHDWTLSYALPERMKVAGYTPPRTVEALSAASLKGAFRCVSCRNGPSQLRQYAGRAHGNHSANPCYFPETVARFANICFNPFWIRQIASSPSLQLTLFTANITFKQPVTGSSSRHEAVTCSASSFLYAMKPSVPTSLRLASKGSVERLLSADRKSA